MAPQTSVIHDIGYQRYTGPRLGRWYANRSLYEHSVRAAFGIGRGAKAKIFPWMIIGIVLLVAVVVIAYRSISGQTLMSYRAYVDGLSYPVMLFLAIVAPELVSRDLRDRTLPLYFSRPLSRTDYALAKFGAIGTAVIILLAVPQLLIYIGAVFTRTDGFSGAWDELGDLGPGLAAALIRALILGSISLLVASLSGRRAFAAAFIVGVFLITSPIAAILATLGNDTIQHLAFLVNPMFLMMGVEQWMFGAPENGGMPIGNLGWAYGVGAVVLFGGSLLLLLQRYRKVAA
ncbi:MULTISPECIES: ABC transporter permease [Dactylosporangium]|uniref:Membrane protein n=2 Tax=Dactylosporangium TaxID=35753 RepID=A0A9W6KLF5_9ACTN|nr:MULTISPECIES: ABC transporter permease subunit [Dactylosporangium]UAB98615.1 ABC transporter permease subunit [Dactylosporangium vinaceum]UWZ46867.1 ABC transporter permease subunit [Dactylosporangium matsuzakiense]GLL04247.1 membrane protein [Dactylosporangium matsuzakiense]